MWPDKYLCNLLWKTSFLWEDPEDEFSLLVGVIRWWDDDILAGRQPEALRDFSHVYVGLTSSFGGIVEEKILLQVVLSTMHLQNKWANLSSRKPCPLPQWVAMQSMHSWDRKHRKQQLSKHRAQWWWVVAGTEPVTFKLLLTESSWLLRAAPAADCVADFCCGGICIWLFC